MKHDYVYLQHIREAAERVLKYTHGDRDAFMGDTMTQDAVVRNLEIIGEAVKRISAAYRDANVDVLWKSIAGMRDRLIHGYDAVQLELIWEAVEQHVPALLVKIETLLKALPAPAIIPESPTPPPPAPPPS